MGKQGGKERGWGEREREIQRERKLMDCKQELEIQLDIHNDSKWAKLSPGTP
jgi:hypothetical protein